MKKTSNTSGFTLIELMIVIVIIGVLAAVTAPSIRDIMNQAKLKQAANSLMNNLKMARSLAVKNGQRVGVSFDTVNNTYLIEQCGKDNKCGDDDPGKGTDDIPIKHVDLKTIGGGFWNANGGVTFGNGPATHDATTDHISFNHSKYLNFNGISLRTPLQSFTARGTPTKPGYIYLTDNTSTRCYAIGFPTLAGVIKMRINTGGEEWKDL